MGMVGVPATIYKVRLHRQDLQDVRAVQITTELMALDNADGVCAGLFACNYTVFDKVWCVPVRASPRGAHATAPAAIMCGSGT